MRAAGGILHEEVERTALAPAVDRAVHRPRQLAVTLPDGGQPFGEEQAQGSLQAEQQILRGRAAELSIRQVALAAHPVPVETRRGVALCHREGGRVDRDEADPGRAHQALLRRAHRDVHAQRVHRERHRAERGHHIDHQQGGMRGRIERAAQVGNLAGRTAGRVGVDGKHGLDGMPAVVSQRLLERRHIDRPAFAPRRAHDPATQRLGLLGPGFAEMTGARHEHRLTWRGQVDDDRLPDAMAIGRVQKDIGVTGLQQLAQAFLAGGDVGIDPRVAQIHRLHAHGMHHGVRQGGGTRRVQETAAGKSGDRVVHEGDCQTAEVGRSGSGSPSAAGGKSAISRLWDTAAPIRRIPT